MPFKDPDKKTAARAAYNASPEGQAKTRAYHTAYRAKPENKARRRAYRAVFNADPEVKVRTSAAAAAYRERPGVRSRIAAQSRERNYGVTPALFDAILEAQSGNCGFCNTPFDDDEKVCVDHTHDSREYVRGIVHRACNTYLAHLDKHDVPHPYRSLPPAFAVGRINRKGFAPSLSYVAAVMQ